MARTSPAVFAKRMQQLVQLSGGVVEDGLFVTRPGCLLLAKTELANSKSVTSLLDSFHIDTERPTYEQFGEFNSRITYLAFKSKKGSSKDYNYKMAHVHGHLSVYGPVHATFLLAGIALETSMELVAHSEARVARLTSSKTNAMSAPLYRLQGTSAERSEQRAHITKLLELRKELNTSKWSKENETELSNMLLPGCKATALTYTMSIKDFHKLFIGRLNPSGNEEEVQEVCTLMCSQLREHYPLIIRAPEEYARMSNADKYTGPVSSGVQDKE